MTPGSGPHSRTRASGSTSGPACSRCCCACWRGWQAAALAAAALVFNLVLLPRLGGRRLYRPVDDARGFPLGILLYPLSVLLLTLAFPSRLDIAAAAWGILAFGDGFATLIGRSCHDDQRRNRGTRRKQIALRILRVPRFRPVVFPGTPTSRSPARSRSWCSAGSPASRSRGGCGRRSTPVPPLAFTLAAPLAAAVLAALVETIPVRLDDNISVPATAAAVMWIASLMTAASRSPASRGMMVARRCRGRSASMLLTGWLGYRARTVSRVGRDRSARSSARSSTRAAARGAWVLLLVTFLAADGDVAPRPGAQGTARASRRSAAAAAAPATRSRTAASPPSPPSPRWRRRTRRRRWLALVAALTAGGSDTVASEIGKAWGRSTFLVTTFRRVTPGTPGAMSLEGTAAGLLAAFALAGDRRGARPDRAVGDPGRRRRRHRGRAGRERAWRDARRTGYPEQRHAQFHQHRGRRRGRRWRSRDRNDGTSHPAQPRTDATVAPRTCVRRSRPPLHAGGARRSASCPAR